MVAGVASAETGGIDTDEPYIPPTAELEIDEAPYIDGEPFTVTVLGFPGSAGAVDTLNLSVDGELEAENCTEVDTCAFELTLEAGTHTLQGNIIVFDGEGVSESLMIEVVPASDTSGEHEHTGGEHEHTGGEHEHTGGEQTTGSESTDDDEASGCRVGGSGAPIAPLAALFSLGLWARRRR